MNQQNVKKATARLDAALAAQANNTTQEANTMADLNKVQKIIGTVTYTCKALKIEMAAIKTSKRLLEELLAAKSDEFRQATIALGIAKVRKATLHHTPAPTAQQLRAAAKEIHEIVPGLFEECKLELFTKHCECEIVQWCPTPKA